MSCFDSQSHFKFTYHCFSLQAPFSSVTPVTFPFFFFFLLDCNQHPSAEGEISTHGVQEHIPFHVIIILFAFLPFLPHAAVGRKAHAELLFPIHLFF